MSADYTPEAAAEHRRTHGDYVRSGKCGAVAWTKAWCNLRAPHTGPHLAPDARRGAAPFTWTGHDGCPCDAAERLPGGPDGA